MNNTAITKILNKVKSLTGEYSLGFARLHALPVRVRRDFNLASIARGENVESVNASQKSFLQSLSDDEFVNWLKNS